MDLYDLSIMIIRYKDIYSRIIMQRIQLVDDIFEEDVCSIITSYEVIIPKDFVVGRELHVYGKKR